MNIGNDNLMKDMLENSRREITNPEFNSIIMNKIMREDRKKIIVKRFSLYFLVFVAISIAIFLIILSAFRYFDSVGIEGISASIERAGLWISEKSRFIVSFFILLLFKKLMTYKLRHS